MNSFERLFAGALLGAVMAMPAYAQTPPAKPVTGSAPTSDSAPANTSAPTNIRTQTNTIAPTNAERAVDGMADPDAVTDGEAVDDDVTIEDSAILPSAGGHEESRAPSMELDCEKNPEDCIEDLDSDSPGPTLSTPVRR